MGLIWNDFGDPEKGELPLLDEESDDDNSADSGIGLSLHSSTIPESQHLGQNIYHCGHEKYKIAVICALPEEMMAVRALFDETRQDLPQHESDANTYALGRLGTHFAVAACLPSGDYGTNAASRVASDIEKSFSAVKWYFVVGIGGGIPSEEHDIRLGDVVVSTGVIQHDMGKVTQKGSKIKSTGLTQRPARLLLTAISSVQSDPSLTHNALEAYIQHIVGVRPEYQSPGEDCDKLFPANSKHISKQKTCENCKGPHVLKKPRPPGPQIHYGLIASGNQVIKDAMTRDRIGAEMNVLCFEMEGAGVMATGNCLVIRGICDYADSHKNDKWHKYAAATAAAYTKLFLLRIPNLDMQNRETVQMGKRSASSMEDDGIYPSQRARYL
jgi:nucleoside phosphorylase